LKWLEIGLTVEEELAEPVADVLSRHAPGGVAMSPVRPVETPGQQLIVIHAYLKADEQVESVRQQVERDLWFLGRIRSLPDPEFSWVEDTDWVEAWKAHFKPLLVGRRLRVQPVWLPSPPDDRLALFIDPGMAFGTGSHPSTQLCLEYLEENVKPGDMIADLGSGSGILSIAAIKLGAHRSLAFDTDDMAVSVCQENAEQNGVGREIVAAVGSLDELKAEVLRSSPPRLVVANIFLSVLMAMLEDGLAEVLAQDGRLILSGVLQQQIDDLLGQANSVGLKTLDVRTREDWAAVLLET
jgi:ribosomal protein L11 methyltransferase